MIAERDVRCPACGRATLTAEGAGEICEVCGWQDDPQQRRDVDFRDGANGISLREARTSFDRFGAAFPPSEAGGS